MKEFLTELWNKYHKDIMYICGIVIMFMMFLVSAKSCSDNRRQIKEDNHNIEALTDSIKYYKSANGNLIAEKTILIGDMSTLEAANKELYDKLQEMKVKNAQQALEIKSLIEHPHRDTTWKMDTCYIDTPSFSKQFEFKDPYRLLAGNIYFEYPDMTLGITQDKVYVDYTIAIKDGRVYVSSENPYVVYNEISGITIPKEKPKHWNVGLQVGIGGQYGIINKTFDVGPYIGVGISYGFGF